MDAPTIAAISSFVTLICVCVVAANGGTLRGWIALGIAALVAGLGTLSWAVSQGAPLQITWLWGLLSGWGLAMGAGLGALMGADILSGRGVNLGNRPQTFTAAEVEKMVADRLAEIQPGPIVDEPALPIVQPEAPPPTVVRAR